MLGWKLDFWNWHKFHFVVLCLIELVQGYRLTTHVGVDFGKMMRGFGDFKSGLMAIPRNVVGCVITILSCCC